MSGGDRGGLADRGIADRAALGEDDHMGAGDILGVQPHIALSGKAQGEGIVLHIVAPDEDAIAVRAPEFQRREGLFPALCTLGRAQIALPRQLPAHGGKLRLSLTAGQRLPHALQIDELVRGLGDLIGEHDLAGFGLVVGLVEALGVHRGTDRGVEGDRDRRVVLGIKILHRHGGAAARHTVQVRLQQIALHPQAFAVGTLL